jgi:hypothetical protein
VEEKPALLNETEKLDQEIEARLAATKEAEQLQVATNSKHIKVRRV